MNTHAFLTWPYLIFLVPGGLAVLLLLLSSLTSLGGDSAGESDVNADVDADAEGHLDVDVHHDGHDGEHDTHSPSFNLLHFLGVGKAPLTLVLGAFLLGWGFAGFWANQLLTPTLKSPAAFVGPAVLLALVGAVVMARAVAAVAVRVIPKSATAAVSRESLVGQEASVVYPISSTAGRAFYYDKNAVLHDVTCRVRPGEATIGKGRKIILSGWDEATSRFWAEASPFEE